MLIYNGSVSPPYQVGGAKPIKFVRRRYRLEAIEPSPVIQQVTQATVEVTFNDQAKLAPLRGPPERLEICK